MDYGPDRPLRLLQLGRWERDLSSRDVWLCLGCTMCGAHCPNTIDVGEVMLALHKRAAADGTGASTARPCENRWPSSSRRKRRRRSTTGFARALGVLTI